MRIKQSNSDNALESLWNEIGFTKDRLSNCVMNNHDMAAVLYISSLIIMPNVVFQGTKLLDEIASMIKTSPNCICLVRTTTPNWFKGHMKTLHQNSVDFLRDKCYVVLYSKRKEYLNHAKFFLHYHVCMSENIVHYGYFYGSTNLTQVGLGNPNGKGNYEEFAVHHNTKYNLSSTDKSYLREVQGLISHKAAIYTDPQYLAHHISSHKRSLKSLITYEQPGNPSTGLLYGKYVSLLTAYNETIALLDELPGKMLTNELVHELTSKKLPTDPFELEMMLSDPEYYDLAAENLGLSMESLQNAIEETRIVLKNTLVLIEQRYEPIIEKVADYLDEREVAFLNFLRQNNERHINYLERFERKE